VLFHGEDATDRRARAPVGFVFQHYALFRHMTIFENVAFGLRVRPKATRPPRRRSAQGHELLGWCSSTGSPTAIRTSSPAGSASASRWPARWRSSRKVLLLDEPFGALDAKVRKELRRWLRRLHDEMHVTSVFVTHDQDEALEVADRVVVMNEGRIEQVGTPDQVYDHPATPVRAAVPGRREPVPRPRPGPADTGLWPARQGLEPATCCLEGSCSIQLSYGQMNRARF
jgi:sulfate transport system ATP-binding protein